MEKDNNIQFCEYKRSWFDKDPEKRISHPFRDWLVVVGVFVLACLFLVTFAVHVFFDIRDESGMIVERSEDGRALDHEGLERVVTEFERRREEYERLRAEWGGDDAGHAFDPVFETETETDDAQTEPEFQVEGAGGEPDAQPEQE